MRREPHVRSCERPGVKFPRRLNLVVGFEHEADARRFWDTMCGRLQEFALTLHLNKTCLIELGHLTTRHAAWLAGARTLVPKVEMSYRLV